MGFRFTALASGSGGNAALVRAGGSGLLIDIGLGSRELADRLAMVGVGWGGIASAVLTHTHGDHVKDAALAALARERIPLFCHEGHRSRLERFAGFQTLTAAGLTRTFDDRPFLTPGGFRVEPIPTRHDGGPSYGFRVEARNGLKGRSASVGFLADSGDWTEPMAEALADVELLAVEFNHDVDLQKNSGRSAYLIARNLGDRGHLSNDQGAALVAAILARSRPGALRNLVLLHLSHQCNRPTLAVAAARSVIRGTGRRAAVHVADQHLPHPDLEFLPAARRRPVARAGLLGFPWESA